VTSKLGSPCPGDDSMDEGDLRARAAECRAYAAVCGHPRLAAAAIDLAEALEDAANDLMADATAGARLN
jgi:hypothetical protein